MRRNDENTNHADYAELAVIMTNLDFSNNLKCVQNVGYVDGVHNLSDAELSWMKFITRYAQSKTHDINEMCTIYKINTI